MTTVKLQGGLGNQMFQYARGRREALKKGKMLVLDLEYLVFPNSGETPRTFGLGVFDIQALILEPATPRPFRRFLERIAGRIFKKERYYQSEKYFKDIADTIKKDFTLKVNLDRAAESAAHLIAQANTSVSLHVRRADYVTDKNTSAHHGVMAGDYYQKAVDYLETQGIAPHLFVFSDDIAWAKENLKFKFPITFVSQDAIKDYEELYLMSLCKHHIIANSSFSWWGAWLDTRADKIVIAPVKWFASENANAHAADIVPADWIRL